MAKEKVSVFDDPSAFRQKVRLSSVQVLGLTRPELATALAYELEPSSGVPAANAEVEFRPVADPDEAVRVFDVALRPRPEAAGAGDPFARFVRPAAVFGVALLALAAADFARLASARSSLRRARAVRAPLDAQIRALERDARTRRDETQRLRATRAEAVRAQAAAAELRAASARALRALADACGTRAALTRVAAPEDLTLDVDGTAVSAQTAADAMAVLAERAARAGWRFRPDAIRMRDSRTSAAFAGRMTHD